MKKTSKQNILKTIGTFALILCCVVMFHTTCYAAGKEGLYQDSNGIWYYYENGVINYEYEGLAENANGTWYVKNGTINTGANGVVQCGQDWYFFKKGQVQFVDSVENNANGWWYINDGKVDFSYDGIASNSNGTWYIENGKVDFNKNGVLSRGNGWYLFNNGKVNKTTTVAQNANGWWYINNGQVDFGANTVASNSNGWWYIKNGKVDFSYDGIASNSNGTWYIENGKVDFSISTVAQRGGNWYFFKGGKLQYITSVENNANGWWYINNGKVDFSYDGIASNSNGTWYIEDGKVDFSISTVAQRGGNWYFFKGGKLQYITSVENNANGWWYINNGQVDFSFDGIASNGNGSWYIQDGKVDFSYTGIYVYKDTTYDIIKGRATVSKGNPCNLPENDQYYKYEYAYKNGGNTSKFTSDEKAFYNGLAKCLDYAVQFNTPYEQEKAVHDYMVLNCQYDMKLVNTGTVSNSEVYSAIGVFKNGVAVCDGYSRAFQLCMDILGIECIRVTGTANGGGHAWNAVKLDGEWYMVDVTWDDPIPDSPNRVIYNYFNITDKQMKRDHEYKCEIQANGKKYNYYNMQENYVTNKDDYYAYINKELPNVKEGKILTVIVELNIPWTSELLSQYMDYSKITASGVSGISVSYSTYVAEFKWSK